MRKLGILVLLAPPLLVTLPLGGCSDMKSTWDSMWHKKAPPPVAAPAPPPPHATMHLIDKKGIGAEIGTVTFSEGTDGLHLAVALTGLPKGKHGFHLHENADCAPGLKDGKMTAGNAAGGHYDPAKSGKHLGPAGEGHQGDLPVLNVAKDGSAKEELVAPHLKLADVKGHALVIHKGGDNYKDKPKPLGGGGDRIACGVVE